MGAFVCNSPGEGDGELVAFGCGGFVHAAKTKHPAMIRSLLKATTFVFGPCLRRAGELTEIITEGSAAAS